MLNTAQKAVTKEVTQFRLTTEIITKLNTFKLTPTAKLVLLYLTTCYNPKHKEVFPKQKTIADKLGISEVSVTRAVSELHKEGLILSERKYTNRYKFTSRIVSECPIVLKDNNSQKEIGKDVNLIPHEHEQKKEPEKEPEEDVLKSYAIKHGAKNVEAYIKALRKNGSADKIIAEYKERQNATKKALRAIEDTQSQIRYYNSLSIDCCTAQECGLSLKDILTKKEILSKNRICQN